MNRPDPGLHNQDTWRGILRIGGGVAVGVGGLLTVIAMADFFGAMGSFEPPRNFWMAFVGLPLIAAGTAMLKAGYLGPASRYVAGELTPTVQDALETFGIGTGRQRCGTCGGESDAAAKYCDDCGAALRRECSSCGTANAPDATYCDRCGRALTA